MTECERCGARIFVLDNEGDGECLTCGGNTTTREPTPEEVETLDKHLRTSHQSYRVKDNLAGWDKPIPLQDRTPPSKVERLLIARGYMKG